jgi:hypothetical protein
VASYPINVYLAQHYNGGHILQTDAPFHLSEAEANIHFSNIIYEGSGSLWTQALQNPVHSVDWVIMQPGDRVANTTVALLNTAIKTPKKKQKSFLSFFFTL